MKKLITTLLSLFFVTALSYAAVPIEQNNDGASLITTKYFGPYAFSVPDFLDGKVTDRITAEIAGDFVVGRIGGSSAKDYTAAPTFRVSLPLWSDRAALSVWGEFHEFYFDTEECRSLRRVSSEHPLKGNDSGNILFSLDLLLLRETSKRPSVALRAATLTATGDQFEVARHYDAPGYFFDLSGGKSFSMGSCSLRLAATFGFVCWQINNGTQNDALLYGLSASLSTSVASLNAAFGGYSGREKVADSPQTLKLRLDIPIKKFSPFCYFQQGLRDWPFTQFRAGLKITL